MAGENAEQVRAEHDRLMELRAKHQPAIDERQRKLDALSPAERLAEMNRNRSAD